MSRTIMDRRITVNHCKTKAHSIKQKHKQAEVIVDRDAAKITDCDVAAGVWSSDAAVTPAGK